MKLQGVCIINHVLLSVVTYLPPYQPFDNNLDNSRLTITSITESR